MKSLTKFMDSFGAILLAIIWVAPLLFAFWAATHSTSDAVNLNLFAPWTLDNFRVAWAGAPWLKYFMNTFMLVTVILIGQFVLSTLAGFAFAQLRFPGKDFVSNAHGHCKFIAMTADAQPLMQAAGLTEVDGGMKTLKTPGDAPAFVKACRAVRFWDRAA